MRQGSLGKGGGEMLPKLYGLCFGGFHFIAVRLCTPVLRRVPAVRCISHHHVDLDPRGANVDHYIVWACACDGGMLRRERCQKVSRVPRDPGIEPKFDVSSCQEVGIRDNSAVVTCLCSASLAGPSFL